MSRTNTWAIGPNSKTTWPIVLGLIGLITLAHLATGMGHVGVHNVARRLYYLPIIVAAFGAGVRGGCLAALAACVAYLPHAFFLMHRDPSPTIDKALEMVLYFGVGALVGWFVDQRERNRARLERALAERDGLERQLVRAGKLSALGDLTAGLAHEIRNPLASILGSAEALASEFPPEHRKHRISTLLLKEIERLGRVVNRFLEFARPAPPQRQAVNLVGVARSLLGLVEHRKVRPQIELADADQPTGGDAGESSGCCVDADPDQASQVLLNLLLNACEAVEADPPADAAAAVTVRFERRTVGERAFLCVGVHDNGPGISDAALEQVFDPYYTTKPDGTGLGLALSSRIMEAHGGFIDVASRPGDNTVWACFPEVP